MNVGGASDRRVIQPEAHATVFHATRHARSMSHQCFRKPNDQELSLTRVQGEDAGWASASREPSPALSIGFQNHGGTKMNDAGERVDGPGKLEQAKEAVQTVAASVQATTKTVAAAIDDARRPGASLDRLAQWARAAPLHSLAIAFLVGVILGRRH